MSAVAFWSTSFMRFKDFSFQVAKSDRKGKTVQAISFTWLEVAELVIEKSSFGFSWKLSKILQNCLFLKTAKCGRHQNHNWVTLNDEVLFYRSRSALLDHLDPFIVFFLNKTLIKTLCFLTFWAPVITTIFHAWWIQCDWRRHSKYSDLFHPQIVQPLLSVRVPAFRLLWNWVN